MNSKQILVVGNKLKEVANFEQAMTFDQVLSRVSSGELQGADFQIEQGISEAQVAELFNQVQASSVGATIRSYYDQAERCSKRYTHKVKDYNTLISEPTKINEQQYQAILMIDENCADLSDQVTKADWQAMIFVEAARQMTLAVTEKFFIDEADRAHLGFVTVSCESQYYGDALPIYTEVKYDIVKTRGLTNRNKSFTVRISFLQNQTVVSEIEYQFSVFEKVHLKAKEQVSAKNIINRIMLRNIKEVSYEYQAA